MTIVDPLGDVTIKVTEYDDDVTRVEGQPPIIHLTAEFQVRKEILIKNSSFFKVLLTSSKYAEAAGATISLEGDHVMSMEIWFRVLHDTITDNTYAVPLDEMWHLAAACDKYDLDIKCLKEWFARWLEQQDMKKLKPRELLYPCWLFDHAKGFATATQHLAYSSTGHITEINPTKHFELHLPPRIIQQLNAAKGRLRTVLHNGLFKPNEKLLLATCICKEKTLFNYEKELFRIKVWPLERVAQHNSMSDLLSHLDKFKYEPHSLTCSTHRRLDLESTVDDAKTRTKDYFDGLCLDCLDRSKPKTGDVDMDYWRHNMLEEDDWVSGCRFRHKQSTWYFSYMGRLETRKHFDKLRREARQRHWGDSD